VGLNQTEVDDFWTKRRQEDGMIPPMSRAMYFRKYPNGVPSGYTGKIDNRYIEWRSAIKRRDLEAKRPGRIKFWWSMLWLAIVFGVASITMGVPYALFIVLVLIMCYCFIEMGMNLPYR
jgi:hypothetical protein